MGLPSVARSAAPTGGVAALPWNQRQLSPGIGGRFTMESVAAFVWNRWQLCRGISGRIHLESVAALPWNTHKGVDERLRGEALVRRYVLTSLSCVRKCMTCSSRRGEEHTTMVVFFDRAALVAMEKHIAFLEGAIGIEMTQLYKEDDLTLSEIPGMDVIACRLVFPSRTSESGWMDDTLVFNTLEEIVTFLGQVELLFRIARAQQRGE